MQICLVRHAIAVERGTGGYVEDSARPLTPEGRDRMQMAARGLQTLFEPQAIFTSPILRARQTAGILAGVYGLPVQPLEALATGDHRAAIVACAAANMDAVALVGHEPWMGELLSMLLTGDAGLAQSLFRKGAAALVSTYGAPAPGNGTLEWLIQPGALRRLARSR